jgi:hypothetical protein
MRLSSTSLLLAGALAAGAAMFNCSAADTSTDEDGLSSDSAVTGIGNPLGLRLLYDQTSSTVRATVREPLTSGEQLRLQVRRGRLSAESQLQLDCNRLPLAPAMPPTVVEANGTPSVVSYQGPVVDPSLLATVYDEQWILNHVTPKMLEELQTQGADSIVEACVMSGSTIKARVQTSVAYAWDQADPLLAYHAPSATTIDVTMRIATNNDPIAATNTHNQALGRPIHSMEKYAELCVDELGDIPFFPKKADGSYDTFDCRDFTTGSGATIPGLEASAVPQSQHDADGNDTTPAECDDAQPGSPNCWKTCDRPDWRSQSCDPGPTVASAKNDRGTHWVMLCRQPGDSTDSVATRTSTKTFNDIAMIGHNPKTGKTCFFQNKLHVGNDGAHITHPADLERSRNIWDNPKGYCTGCHSADAFIHSPWIDAAHRSDNTPIVPMMGKHPDFEISWLAAPYSVVNRPAMDEAQISGSAWPKPKQLISEEASACYACHRIGNGDGMKRFPMWSTGEDGIASTRVSGTYDGTISKRYSPAAQTFEATHWMPPRLAGLDASSWGNSAFAKAVSHIKNCAANEADPTCKWADVPGE